MPVFERNLLSGGAENRAGIVDQDIHAAKFIFDLREKVLGAGGGGEVSAKSGSVSANLRCCFRRSPAVAVACDRRSRLRKPNGNRGAQTAGRARDQGYFVIQPEAVENIRRCIWHGLG